MYEWFSGRTYGEAVVGFVICIFFLYGFLRLIFFAFFKSKEEFIKRNIKEEYSEDK